MSTSVIHGSSSLPKDKGRRLAQKRTLDQVSLTAVALIFVMRQTHLANPATDSTKQVLDSNWQFLEALNELMHDGLSPQSHARSMLAWLRIL